MLPQARLDGSRFGVPPISIAITAPAFLSGPGLVQRAVRPTVRISQYPRSRKDPS